MGSNFTDGIHASKQAAAEQSMGWMVTPLYGDVASRPKTTRSRRSARLSVARLQSAGGGSGSRDQEMCARRAPLRGYVLVEISTSRQAVNRSVSVLGSDG